MIKYKTRFPILFVLAIIFLSSQIYGQTHSETEHNEHEFKNFRIAINLGHAYIPSSTTADNKFVVLPV